MKGLGELDSLMSLSADQKENYKKLNAIDGNGKQRELRIAVFDSVTHHLGGPMIRTSARTYELEMSRPSVSKSCPCRTTGVLLKHDVD